MGNREGKSYMEEFLRIDQMVQISILWENEVDMFFSFDAADMLIDLREDEIQKRSYFIDCALLVRWSRSSAYLFMGCWFFIFYH